MSFRRAIWFASIVPKRYLQLESPARAAELPLLSGTDFTLMTFHYLVLRQAGDSQLNDVRVMSWCLSKLSSQPTCHVSILSSSELFCGRLGPNNGDANGRKGSCTSALAVG